MSLFQKACETYDYHQHLVGVYEEGKVPLVPVGHTFKSDCQLEITLDPTGNILSIENLTEKEGFIIPVTVESGSRSGKKFIPHPLCDSLKYITSCEKELFDLYVFQLSEWAQSRYAVPQLQVILACVTSGKLIKQLHRENVIVNNDKLTSKEEKLFVRWRVVGLGEDEVPECWKNKSLFKSWTDYYLNVLGDAKMMCMVGGTNSVFAGKHPKNIVGICGNAKILSANDASNFTYRGRFNNSEEAYSVGYVVSQKAHNALRWEASRGVIIGERIFLCWNPKGKQIPSPGWMPFKFTSEERISPTDYYQKLKDTLNGYRNDLPAEEDIVIVSMQAATSGRLSITYYNELKASDFLERLEIWYRTCCWDSGIFGVQAPSIYQIVLTAYGTERVVNKVAKLESDDKISKDIFQRLNSCIIDKQNVPYDIVRALYCKVSKPESYTSQILYRKCLFVACAVIRKYLNDKVRREEWSMKLDKTKVERSYLFGRLLAIMEKVELDTFEKDEKREPNAIRMQSAFVEKPFACTKVLHERLAPYFAKQGIGGRRYYKTLIGEVMEKLTEYSDQELNKPLKEPYLLGYYLQRNDLYKSRKDDREENENGSSAE